VLEPNYFSGQFSHPWTSKELLQATVSIQTRTVLSSPSAEEEERLRATHRHPLAAQCHPASWNSAFEMPQATRGALNLH